MLCCNFSPESKTFGSELSSIIQVGSPTKARAGLLKVRLPLNWEATVGFTKWGIVIFSDLVSKGRLARLDLQDQICKVGLTS